MMLRLIESHNVVLDVTAIFKKHLEKTNSILQDYISSDELTKELQDANKSLIKELGYMEAEKEESSPSKEALINFAEENNCKLIQMLSMEHANRLLEFLETEIYPHYQDQKKFILA